jgi:hypothetical protein
MANTSEQHTQNQPQNQPTRDDQSKGGQQHSRQGHKDDAENRSSGSKQGMDDRSRNQPSHESQVKGGQQSHSGGNR